MAFVVIWCSCVAFVAAMTGISVAFAVLLDWLIPGAGFYYPWCIIALAHWRIVSRTARKVIKSKGLG